MKKEVIDQITQFIDEQNLHLVESEKYNYRYRIVRKGESERTTQFILNVVPKVLLIWKPNKTLYDIHITKHYINDDALDSIKHDIEVVRRFDSFADIMEDVPNGDNDEEGFRRTFLFKLPVDIRSSQLNIFGLHNGVAWNAKPHHKVLNTNAYGSLRMSINKTYGVVNINAAKNAMKIIHEASKIYNQLK